MSEFQKIDVSSDHKGNADVDRYIDAAPGVKRHEVSPVNAKENRELYSSRVPIYPKRVSGTYRNLKWIAMALTLGVYYILPWLRWERGENLPNQAFLIDFANQRILFFGLEIWAQEFYYVTGLLVVATLLLYLITSLAGRVWCGYSCPQTVWTDLMIAVERFFEGDRNARMKLDKSPWNFTKIRKKAATHFTWLIISVATGGMMVFYFRDAPTLMMEFINFEAPAIAYIFLGIFAGTTYLLGGFAREQVCTYMCPWPRIQGALFDKDSLLVTYRDNRGEPRGPHKKNEPWDNRGDCITCKQCVVVCPMGIDIREGPQLECIQCALCIDACNSVMDKIGRPRNLIAYDSYRNIEMGGGEQHLGWRLIRARTILYTVLIFAVSGLMAYGLLSKSVVDVSVLRDRNPLYVRLSDGSVRNGYTVKILNKLYETRRFKLEVEGLPQPQMSIIGVDETSKNIIDVTSDDLRILRVYLKVPHAGLSGLKDDITDFNFMVTDLKDDTKERQSTTFRRPK